MVGQQHRDVGRPIRAVLLGACLVFAVSLSAKALDFNDIRNLIINQAPENVIVNMIRQDPNLTITQEQADQLRAVGASENLVSAFRISPDYGTSPAVTQSYPGAAYPADGGTYQTPTAIGTGTYPADGGTYPAGDYGYGYSDSDYDYYDSDYDDFEGEYYQQQAGTTTTYTDPTIYQQQPTVIVQQPAPTVIYDSPTYVYPTPSVVVGGYRHRPPPPRYHRPPPVVHRPPPPRPSHGKPPPPPRPGHGSKPPPTSHGKPPPDHGKPPRR